MNDLIRLKKAKEEEKKKHKIRLKNIEKEAEKKMKNFKIENEIKINNMEKENNKKYFELEDQINKLKKENDELIRDYENKKRIEEKDEEDEEDKNYDDKDKNEKDNEVKNNYLDYLSSDINEYKKKYQELLNENQKLNAQFYQNHQIINNLENNLGFLYYFNKDISNYNYLNKDYDY